MSFWFSLCFLVFAPNNNWIILISTNLMRQTMKWVIEKWLYLTEDFSCHYSKRCYFVLLYLKTIYISKEFEESKAVKTTLFKLTIKEFFILLEVFLND